MGAIIWRMYLVIYITPTLFLQSNMAMKRPSFLSLNDL